MFKKKVTSKLTASTSELIKSMEVLFSSPKLVFSFTVIDSIQSFIYNYAAKSHAKKGSKVDRRGNRCCVVVVGLQTAAIMLKARLCFVQNEITYRICRISFFQLFQNSGKKFGERDNVAN